MSDLGRLPGTAARTVSLSLVRYCWLLLGYCVAVIAFGGFVSSSLSGDGCGMHWPDCHGSLLPDGSLKSLIESSHRYTSGLLLLLTIFGTIWTRRKLDRGHPTRRFMAMALAFTVAEALIGAVLVKTGWVARDTSIGRVFVAALHLVNTFGLLACLALASQSLGDTRQIRARGSRSVGWLLLIGTIGLLALGASGAVASMGDQIFPAKDLAAAFAMDLDPASHFLVRLRVFHPLIATSVGILLVAVAGVVTHRLGAPSLRKGAQLLVGLFTAQMALGMVNLLTNAPLVMQTAHLLLSDILWVSFVMFASNALRSVVVSEVEAQPRTRSGWREYVALTKPRVVSLLLFTTLAAAFVGARGVPPLGLLLALLVGGYMMAGAANTINMLVERDLDEAMERTSHRPTVTHSVTDRSASLFACVLGFGSFGLLSWAANLLTAVLALAGLVYYVLVYTLWLKRRTWHNIVIGGAAGAIPPLVGYAGATGQLSPLAWYLFAVIFTWTPVHFWALALLIKDDYANAGVPMLPVVKGERATVVQIAFYAVLTALVSVMPFLQAEVGWTYLVGSGLLNLWLVVQSFRLLAGPGRARARTLFKASMAYLALFFVVVAVDQVRWIS